MTHPLSPSSELLLLEQPQFPSARLLHTLRWVIARYGLDLVVWPEEAAFVAVHTAPETLTGRLVHVPHGLFPPDSGLQDHLRQAGVRWNYLPPLPQRPTVDGHVVDAWETLLQPGALSQWLASGTPTPAAGAGDGWLGPRRAWHGVPLTVRRVTHD